MDASSASTSELWSALFGPDSIGAVETTGALSVAVGRCNSRPLRVALTDRSISGGSFGVDECNALSRLFARSLEDRIPVALVLDSGGARIDSGLAGLAAFRRLYRAALDLRLSGVPMSAIALRNCFGGASMLVMLCARRAALRSARIGMSGPGIVDALSGKTDLDSSDDAAVQFVFGASARAEIGAIDQVVAEDALLGEALARLLENSAPMQPDIQAQHQRLGQRLRRAGVAMQREKGFDAGLAFQTGLPVGASELWMLADQIICAPAGQSMKLLVDCPGQAATRHDEALVLSEYVAHLAMCLRAHCIDGGEIVVHMSGESAGGIYVALAAGADRVDAGPGAIARVLPSAAVRTVLGRVLPDESLEHVLAAGVVDSIVTDPGDQFSLQ